jgi:acetyl esterase/lipase
MEILAMPSIRARVVRLMIRRIVGRRFERAGRSIEEWRRLDDFLTRSQRPLKGTEIEVLSAGVVKGEWVWGPGSRDGGLILYLHGGGFIIGSPATHRELASRISEASGFPVFSLEYRLAPEHPFPAPLNDTRRAYQWLLSEGYSPGGIVLGGDSAGAGLALQALLAMREEGIALPAAAFFMSPVTDWVAMDGESYTTRAHSDPLISEAQCRWTASLYAGGQGASEPLLQPLLMDLDGLPPVWIQAGDHEVLLSDSTRLAVRAEEARIPTEFKVWAGMWHVFQSAARFVPEGRESLEDLGRFVRGILATSEVMKR